MPNEPRWVAVRDHLLDSLALMSRANGYHYDYAPTVIGSAAWPNEGDTARPAPHLEWTGTIAQGGGSDETATNRFRRDEGWSVSFVVQSPDGDHERMAARIRADVHMALMGGTPSRRTRGEARVNTFDLSTTWSPGGRGAEQEGGILDLGYATRGDHVAGDMSSQ